MGPGAWAPLKHGSLPKRGPRSILGDVLAQEGREVEAEINGSGGQALFATLDVTDAGNWQRVINAAVDRFGKLNVLVNNAGILVREELEEGTEAGWDRTMDVNAKGVYLGTKLVVPHMRKAGGGSVINISSISGIVSLGVPRIQRLQGGRSASDQERRRTVR